MGTKSSKSITEPLSDAELEALMLSTKMSKEEISKWHRGFMLDCPSGRLTKKEFIKIYEELFPSVRAKRFCDAVFNVFDKNQTNTIDFNEFILACSLTSRGKSTAQLKASFQVYDNDTNGILRKEEMQKIMKAVHELYAGIKISESDSLKKVNQIMDTFDRNQNGSITKIDFLEGISNDPQIRNAMFKQESLKSLKSQESQE
ncbi:unnamed protein product [Brachionus calyciflorus]|uniref:EF-hand domain-containing protein n=1 Tax=Brachionus calyciflorus TaxID=104777 RepID=A0A814LMI2_9BILA|nr:unnamed protein product [Brachionus calyciflorus]